MSNTGGQTGGEGEGRPEREISGSQTSFGVYEENFDVQTEPIEYDDESSDEEDDDSLDESSEDEDFENGEVEDRNKQLFDSAEAAFLRFRQKPCLAVFKVNDGKFKILVQNLGQPLNPYQQPNLNAKAEKLKEIGQYIIEEGLPLIKIALETKILPKRGCLPGFRKNDGESDTNFSKIVSNELIELPDGKVYSLQQFLRGSGGGEKNFEEKDMLIFRSKNLSITKPGTLARMYRDEGQRGSYETYRKRFGRGMDDYLKNFINKLPKEYSAKQMAWFYLIDNELETSKELLQAVTQIIEHFKSKNEEFEK